MGEMAVCPRGAHPRRPRVPAITRPGEWRANGEGSSTRILLRTRWLYYLYITCILLAYYNNFAFLLPLYYCILRYNTGIVHIYYLYYRILRILLRTRLREVDYPSLRKDFTVQLSAPVCPPL